MRVRLLLAGLSLALVGFSFGVQACSSDGSAFVANDAGLDAADATTPYDAAVPDTGTDAETDAGCDTNADFTTRIPDASVPDSSTTTGLCVACANTECPTEVSNCNHSCSCQNIADKALVCYAKSGGDLFAAYTCVGSTPKDTKNPIALLGCLKSKCGEPCAIGQADAGDAGN